MIASDVLCATMCTTCLFPITNHVIFKMHDQKLYGLIPVIHTDARLTISDTFSCDLGNETEGFVDMETLYVPDNITSIKWNGLGRYSFVSFVVSESNSVFQTKEGILYTQIGYDREGNTRRKHLIELVACPTLVEHHIVMSGTKRIANCAFKGCKISSLILPDKLEEIGTNAFYMAKNLKHIVIPKSIRRIEPQSWEFFSEVKFGDQTFSSWDSFIEFLLANGYTQKGRIIIKDNH